MNSTEARAFLDSERVHITPPELTARQEYVAGLYAELSDVEDELDKQMDRRAALRDKLRDIGEVV